VLGAALVACTFRLSASWILAGIAGLALFSGVIALGMFHSTNCLTVSLGVAIGSSARLALFGSIVALHHLCSFAIDLTSFLSTRSSILEFTLGLRRIFPVALIATAISGTKFRRASKGEWLSILEATTMHTRVTGLVVYQRASHTPTTFYTANASSNAARTGQVLIATITSLQHTGLDGFNHDIWLDDTTQLNKLVKSWGEIAFSLPGHASRNDVNSHTIGTTERIGEGGWGSGRIRRGDKERMSFRLFAIVQGDVSYFVGMASTSTRCALDSDLPRLLRNRTLVFVT
jgi:hypothetical protein